MQGSSKLRIASELISFPQGKNKDSNNNIVSSSMVAELPDFMLHFGVLTLKP